MNKVTRRRRTVRMASLGLLLFMAVNNSILAGDFHYYIDTETAYTVNQKSQLSEVNFSWVYDEKMSGLMREQSSDLRELGEATIKHLYSYHYFTSIQFNGEPVKTGQVTHFNLKEFTSKGRAALRLDFTLPVLQPLNMKGQNKLTWSCIDPTGVAILNYSTPKNIRLGRVLQSHCKVLMKENEGEDGNTEQLLSLECSI